MIHIRVKYLPEFEAHSNFSFVKNEFADLSVVVNAVCWGGICGIDGMAEIHLTSIDADVPMKCIRSAVKRTVAELDTSPSLSGKDKLIPLKLLVACNKTKYKIKHDIRNNSNEIRAWK